MNKKIFHIFVVLGVMCFYVNGYAAVEKNRPFEKINTGKEKILSGKEKDTKMPPTPQKNDDEGNLYEALTTSIDPMAFTKGYDHFEKKDYHKALPYFFNYLSNHSPDDLDYEWGEFFFGISLIRGGFTHAGVDILSNLVTQKPNPKIVTYCLELFEEITRTIPFDRERVILKVLCDQEYGFVDQTLQDFINYHQGVFDWEHGLFSWGRKHFESITPGTYYNYKYQYQRALYSIYKDKIDPAIDILEKILSDHLSAEYGEKAEKPSDFLDDVRRTLARLLYEKGEFGKADFLYQQIEKSVLEEALNLLERAWVQYRMGNAEKAMGLLFAFEAPSFRKFFTPEYYLLKSFIYKDVCHYQSAVAVVHEFHGRYGETLSKVYNRGKITDNRELLLVILNKKAVKETWDFLGLLDAEKEKTNTFEEKERALYKFLEKLYALQIQKSADYLDAQINEEYEKMANELLKYEEEAYLMEYEIGLDMSKRVAQFHPNEDKPKKNKSGIKKVAYPFQGEFWNDELTDYKVTLTNKCKCMEEWDIFFK